MTIKNFRKFIESKINDPIKKISFNDVIGKIKSVCIDINIFIYKFITAIRKTGKDLFTDGKITSHLIGLRHQINLFKKLNIDPIYVFDGTPPKEKSKIIKQRNEIKEKAISTYSETKSILSYQQSFFIDDEIISNTIDFLEENNIKYIYDENVEADIICASLVKKKIVDCAYSTDYDILAFGANCLIINIDYRKKYIEYISLKYILNELDISYDEFIDMIVLSGCDYCERTETMTLNKAYALILSEKKIRLNKMQKRAKDIFINSD